MPLNISDFRIEPLPVRESAGLIRLGQMANQNREWQYRHQKDIESDQWRKLNLIQDLTDLSKHQTGSDVANSLGNKLMSDIYQKYTTNAEKMSPLELQANIQKDMSGIITGMEGVKNELGQADVQMAKLKQLYPDLDTATLYNQYRQDILHRRLNDNTTGFKNEMEVPRSQIDLANPDFLSQYVTGDKNLKSYFSNPQGLDASDIYSGDRTNYTRYTAKIPPWKKPNFNPEDVVGGFLKQGVEPRLQFKSSTLPSDSLPNSKGQPFEMMDKDVYDQLGAKEKLELTAATRRQFPDYDKMNQVEKEYAQRNVLLKAAKANDQLDFHPTEIKTPSASLLKFYAGGSGAAKGDVNINQVYQGIKDDVKEARKSGLSYLVGNQLKSDATDIVLKAAQRKGYPDLTQKDIKIGLDDNDNIEVFYSNEYLAANKDEKNPLITTLTPTDVDLRAKQLGVKEKREVIKRGEGSATTGGSDTYTYQGITGTYDQLVEVVGKAEADKLIKTGKAKKK